MHTNPDGDPNFVSFGLETIVKYAVSDVDLEVHSGIKQVRIIACFPFTFNV